MMRATHMRAGMEGRASDGKRDDSDRRDVFEAFFEREYSHLLGGMYLACGNQQEAENLAQEAMARAFEHWERVAGARNPVAYVHQIGFNLLHRRVKLLSRILPQTREELVDVEERATTSVAVIAALKKLPLNQRRTVVLVEWLDMPEEEVAVLMHIRPATVRTRLHRARARIRQELGENSDAE